MRLLYRINSQLLAGSIGGQAVGWSSVAILILMLTGLFAWWSLGSRCTAIASKRQAVTIHRLRDLHKLSGLWSMVLLSVLVATGVLLTLPSETRAPVAPAPIPTPQSSDPRRRLPGSYVFVDQCSSFVLGVYDVRREGAGTGGAARLGSGISLRRRHPALATAT